MNKKLITIALVLLIAVSGVFAVTFPTSISATLNATVGDFFYHGFGQSLTSTLSVTNAFAPTPPTIEYGYATNVGGATIRFTISNFVKPSSTDVVKIKSVTASGGGSALVWDATASAYKLFVVGSVSAYTKQLALITVTPARTADIGTNDHNNGSEIALGQTVESAATGEYTATLTFSVTAS